MTVMERRLKIPYGLKDFKTIREARDGFVV